MQFDLSEMMEIATTQFKPVAQVEVDERTVQARTKQAVASMASRGYVFSEATVQAVAEYYRGFGIGLSGGVGLGKTLFFRLLTPDAIIMDINEAMRWNYDQLLAFLHCYKEREMVLDDIGAGTTRGNDWGVAYDALMVILNARQKSRARTHITTNLDNDALIKAYDYRAVDRMYGMVKFITLPKVPSLRVPRQFTNN